MKNFYCVIRGKCRKFKNSRTTYIFEEILVLSIICSACDNEDEKIFKEEESIKVLRTLGLVKNV